MVWQRLMQRWTGRQDAGSTASSRRKTTRRRLSVQSLAKRELLASDLAAISGTAFVDADGSGTLNNAESAIEGVLVTLYRDFNDDGLIDAGDNVIGTVTTTADGRYRFTNLDGDDDDGDPTLDLTLTNSGRYILEFTDPAGGPDLSSLILPEDLLVTITADTGVTQQVIDAFTAQQTTGGINFVPAPSSTFADSSGDLSPASGIVGDERDIQFDIGNNPDSTPLDFRVNPTTNRLTFDAGTNLEARLTVQYDGVDTDGGGVGTTLTLNPVGLGGVSLNRSAVDDPATSGIDEAVTSDSAAGLLVNVQSDQAAASLLEVIIYTDATNFATQTLSLPGGNVATDIFLPFSLFTPTGTPDFANVGAIEIVQSAGGPAGLDIGLSILESQRSNETNVDAAFIQPMVLGGEIFLDNGGGVDATEQNNGLRDAGEIEFPAQPANPIVVELYALTDLNDTVAIGDTPIATTTVAGGATTGAYSFETLTNGDRLGPGTYAVVIPADQFGTGEPLFGFQGSIRAAGYVNADDDNDANNDGLFVAGVGFVSGAITLVVDGEPGADDNTNTTVDFGVLETVDLRITKSVNVAESDIRPDGSVVFDLTIQNLGPLDATNVTVRDFIPAGLTFTDVRNAADAVVPVTTEVEAGETREIRQFVIGALAAGGSVTFQLTAGIDDDITIDPTNEAEVSGYQVEVDNDPINADATGGNLDDDPLLNNVSTALVDIPLAVLSITKTDGETTASAGDQLTYDIVISNISTDDAINVVAFDSLPPGVTFVSGSFTTGTGAGPIELINDVNDPNNGRVRIPVGTLDGDAVAANRESVTASIIVLVDPAIADNFSPINNTVTAGADNAADVTANDNTTITREVDLTINKTVVSTRTPDDRMDNDDDDDIIDSVAPFQPVAGGFVTYQIRATNAGPSQARGVVITDTLDPGLTFVTGSLNPLTSGVTVVQTGQLLTFTVPDMDPDDPNVTTDDIVFTFEVGIASNEFDVIPNTSVITTTDNETNPANNTSSISIDPDPRLDLFLTKGVAPATAVPGRDQVVYTFTVEHDVDSLSDAINAVVTDTLPAGLTGVTIDAPGATGTPSFNTTTRVVQVNYATIPVGTTRTFTITATVNADAVGPLVNNAVVDVPGVPELDETNNDDSATVTLTPAFDLQIDKTVSGAVTTFTPGQQVTFNIVVSHDLNDDGTEADDGLSPSAATGVVVTDVLPANMTFVSATSGGTAVVPTNTNGTLVFPAFTLAPTATRTLTVVATVGAAASGTLTNTASLVAAAGETDLTNNSDPATITVTPQTNVTLTKAVNSTSASVGDDLTYTITVSNVGPAVAGAVTVTDTLPTGVTFVSGTGPGGAVLSAVGQTVTFNGGDLAATTGTFQLTIIGRIAAGATGTLSNTASVVTTTAETVTTDNAQTVTTTVIQPVNRIAGTVFVDLNGDGRQQPGDVGAAGVMMQLTGGNLTSPLIVMTDEDGDYEFNDLASGTYTVTRLTLPAETLDGLETAGTGAIPAPSGEAIGSITVGGTATTNARLDNDFAVTRIISKRRYLASFHGL